MRKSVTICIKYRTIKCKSMHVDGFHIKLHKTRIQYRNLNMHMHTLASNCIHNKERSIQYYEYRVRLNLKSSLQSQQLN